jgi:HK97 family phage major capsid protein
MDPIQKLRDERAALIKECGILIRKENPSDEDRAAYDEKMARAETLGADIDRLVNLTDAEAMLSESEGRKAIANDPKPKKNEERTSIEVLPPNIAKDPTGGYGAVMENRGWRNIDVRNRAQVEQASYGCGDFAMDVVRAAKEGPSDRLRKWDAAYRAAGDGMTVGVGHEGGYLIPPQFGSLIQAIGIEGALIRPRATRIPMTSLTFDIPWVDDTSHSSSTVFGGIAAYFKSEEAQFTSSKPKIGGVELRLHKLTALAYASNEILDWSPVNISSWLPERLGQAITWKEEQKFITGTGTGGEPTGVLQASAATQISKETDQKATTLVTENIIKMDARLWDLNGRAGVFWLANRTCKVQLAQMTLSVGTGGVPVFLPANGLAGRPSETLYGYPILWTEHCKALGTAGDLMLVNGSQYWVGDASNKTRVERDMSLKFDYDQTAFKVVTYTGGVCPWRSAFTPENGDSLSPILYLEARS